mmetsp:Transcript_50064/g.116454  ORF Transcript_50064/g.116454 Transcript_50064/m.116454 type:complete len:264 (+) Transcript_50064:66-857(+)
MAPVAISGPRAEAQTLLSMRCHNDSAALTNGWTALGGGVGGGAATTTGFGCFLASRASRKRAIAARISPSTLATASLLFWYWARALSWACSLAFNFTINSSSRASNSWNVVSTPWGFAALTLSNSAFAASKSCSAFFCSSAISVSWLKASFFSSSNLAVFSATRCLHSARASSRSLIFCRHSAMEPETPLPKPSNPFNLVSATSCFDRASSAALWASSAAASAAAALSFSPFMSFSSSSSLFLASSVSFCTFLISLRSLSYFV